MTDWELFASDVPWAIDSVATIVTHEPRQGYGLTEAASAIFPPLNHLLETARVTPVLLDGTPLELLAWDAADGDRFGWLCRSAPGTVPAALHRDHRLLLASFGGIVERFYEPQESWWLLNHNEALTSEIAIRDASFIAEGYAWAFEDAGLSVPIEPTEYYVIAEEGNGNVTLCHRATGRVLLFAPDHDFDHVKTLEGCPDYSLYTIDGVTNFRDWVNAIARQWMDHGQP